MFVPGLAFDGNLLLAHRQTAGCKIITRKDVVTTRKVFIITIQYFTITKKDFVITRKNVVIMKKYLIITSMSSQDNYLGFSRRYLSKTMLKHYLRTNL